MSTAVVFTVSGAAYYAACDPNASNVPTEEQWPEPTMVKVGYGATFRYPAEPGLIEVVESHLRLVGEGLLYGDVETRVEARACLRAADRLVQQIAKPA